MLFGSVFAALFVVHAASADKRAGIVHLFEWRFDDIAKECEQFLGPYGFAGIQVSPVNEYAIIQNRPWWERYQPFSFKIISRSGDENGFKDMCSRCNKAGVKVYVDVTLNDMSATQPAGTKGTGGSVPDTANKNYPDVPFTAKNFHQTCAINNYDNAKEVRECELVGLHDLDQSQEDVRKKMVEFLDKLVDFGASGFRVDAAKHIYPADLKAIMDGVKDLPSGERPLVYQEVAQGGAVTPKEYFDIGLVTEFKHGEELSNCFRGNNAIKWLRNWGEGPEGWGLIPSNKALVFIDNHDTQRDNNAILTYKDSKIYKMAVGFMLASGYGTPRIMSSFEFSGHDQGPPANSDESIKNVGFNADLSCSNGWVCEHRWRAIYSMVKFAGVVQGTNMTNFTPHADKQISFCRGNKGFVAFNGENWELSTTAQTCLPAGTYCDVISGGIQNGKCAGKSIQVDSDGTAEISLRQDEDEGLIAFHLESKIESSTNPDVKPPTPSGGDQPTPSGGDVEEYINVKEIIDQYDESYGDYRTFLCKRLKVKC